MKKRQEVLLFAVGAVLLLVVAFSVRMHSLPVAMMLGDSAGPWLVAWGDPWSGHAHAPLYGWGLLVPYRLALGVSGSLWEAVSVLQVFHALVAPLAFLLVLILRPGAWIAATLAGLALALDGGLLDTARSGSETYLGALWVGLILLGRLKASTRWGPTVAWWAFAMAVMNHPLAVLEKLMRIMVRMVAAGIIHGDFNEFNLIRNEFQQNLKNSWR